jgi:hypothetical protein
MQRSALQGIKEKAGPLLPIMRGRDPGLPKAPPVFDLDKMREKNIASLRKRVTKGSSGV